MIASVLLVDTAGLIAWAWGHDETHRLAKQQWDSQRAGGYLPIVPKICLIECLSTLQRIINPPSQARQVAILVGQQLRDFDRHDPIQIIEASHAQEQEAWEIFDAGQVEEMTFADCLCVAVAKRRKLSVVFSPQAFFQTFEVTPLLIGR